MTTSVLQFSGGKDSLACLLLLKDQLDKIIVAWVDSGDAFPETYKQMEAVKAMCPHFLTVHGNQPAVIAEYGYPVDVLPCHSSVTVQQQTSVARQPLQPFMDCCGRSLMNPMHNAMKAIGATVIIRGQKSCDEHKGPLKSGDVVDGITYIYPIEDWTDDDVMEFVKDSPLLPQHYDEARTSLDCMHCTAYLHDNQWKLPYLLKYHPKEGKEVHKRLNIIQAEIDKDVSPLKRILNGVTK